MEIKKALIRNIVAPFLHHLIGWDERLEYYNYVKKHEYMPMKDNLSIQQAKLFEIIDHAVKNVPYYRDTAQRINFKYSLETIYDDIKRLPFLTKDIIRKEFDNLQWLEYNKMKKINTSGGSTGEPVRFVQDHTFTMHNWTEYADSLGGYEFGDKLVRLWGSERDIIQGTIGLKAKILNKFYKRTLFLNSFRMNEEMMYQYINMINKFRPKVIIAYVQSVYELSRFIEQKGLSIYSPHAIITSAGTLYPEFREKIQEVFRCELFNRYGSREVGCIAMECEKHEGMHLNTFAQYVELLDNDGCDVEIGNQGEIFVTLLTNFAMPLIRFKIGDIGIKTSHECSCGRGWPLIGDILGRTVSVFKTLEGDLIDGEYFTHLFYFIDFISKFQIVQQDYKKILIRLQIENEKDFNANKDIFNDIDQKIRLVMGDDCSIEYSVEDEILPSSSGKFIYTISHL